MHYIMYLQIYTHFTHGQHAPLFRLPQRHTSNILYDYTMTLDYVLRVLSVFSVQFWITHCSVLTRFGRPLSITSWIKSTHVAFLLQLKKLNVFKTCAQQSRWRRKILLTTRLKCINNFPGNICARCVHIKYEHFLRDYRGNAHKLLVGILLLLAHIRLVRSAISTH